MTKKELEYDVNNGLSSYQIAKKYGKSQGSITYQLKKHKLKTKLNKIGDGYFSPNKQNYDENGTVYNKIDWDECQRLYDSGLTWLDLIKKGFSHNGMYWGVKNGKFKTRTISDGQKLAWKTGKQKTEIYQTKEHRKKMSKFGGYRENSGRCKHISYNKKDGSIVNIQGSWEEKVAKFLDEKNINWSRNKLGYKYIFEGSEYSYFPDFILTDKNIFIEVKGYETEKDREKWKQFPFKLFIVKKQEIKNLDIWWKNNFGS